MSPQVAALPRRMSHDLSAAEVEAQELLMKAAADQAAAAASALAAAAAQARMEELKAAVTAARAEAEAVSFGGALGTDRTLPGISACPLTHFLSHWRRALASPLQRSKAEREAKEAADAQAAAEEAARLKRLEEEAAARTGGLALNPNPLLPRPTP